jgi:ubiquinone/menaquinone biosynthesis C-methylase UbiE
MPFADQSFNAAFSVSVWHLLSDLLKASQELNRVLNETGQYLVVTANPGAYSLWTSEYSETTLDGRRLEGLSYRDGKMIVQDTLYLHTLDEILASFKYSGLSVSQTGTFRATRSGQEQYVYIKGCKPR